MMRLNCATCVALALLGLCSATARADLGGLGPSSKFGGIGTGTTQMGSRAANLFKPGSIGPARAMDSGGVGPSANNYMGTVGGTIYRGSPLFLPTALIGGTGFSTLRNGTIGVRSIDILPRGEGVIRR